MNQLQRIIAGAKALEIARTVPEVKLIRDQAKAISDYFKQQKTCVSAGQDAAELQLRSERKLGELIPEQFPKGATKGHKGQKPMKSQPATSLVDSGISKTQSSRWQKVAEVPEPDFNDYVAAMRSVSKEPSTSGVIRVRKQKVVRKKLKAIETKESCQLSGLYDVLVVDPPWPMEKIERDCRENQTKELDYPVMTIEDISAVDIPAKNDCHLWLWTTHRFLPSAFGILAKWGFKYVCAFVWRKPGGFQPVGLPQYNCEFALYARKGSPVFLDTKDFGTCFDAKRGKHSEKPEEFYATLRRVTSGRRADLFNRRLIEGFDGSGKEAQ